MFAVYARPSCFSTTGRFKSLVASRHTRPNRLFVNYNAFTSTNLGFPNFVHAPYNEIRIAERCATYTKSRSFRFFFFFPARRSVVYGLLSVTRKKKKKKGHPNNCRRHNTMLCAAGTVNYNCDGGDRWRALRLTMYVMGAQSDGQEALYTTPGGWQHLTRTEDWL